MRTVWTVLGVVVGVLFVAWTYAAVAPTTALGGVFAPLGAFFVAYVDVSQDVRPVPLKEARGGAFHHVDGGLVGRHVVPELRRPEHQVVPQVVGPGELRVVVGTDRLAGEIGRNVKQAHSWLAHASLTSSRPG